MTHPAGKPPHGRSAEHAAAPGGVALDPQTADTRNRAGQPDTSRPPQAGGEHEQVEQAVARFEDAWLAGQRPAIADYLGADPARRQVELVELIHTDLEY